MPRNNLNHQNVNPSNNLNRRIRTVISPETTAQSPPPSKPNPKFLSLLLKSLIMAFVISLFFIFVGVAAIIFLHLCVAGGALHRQRNRRRPISQDGETPPGCSLELLNDLPKARFNGVEICAICLEIVEKGEFIRVLPNCDHVFHVNCVDKWLLKVPVCPTCRGSVQLSGRDRTDVIGWERLWAACG